ncbi:hypothetical protein ABK040_010268 [Willaertia magna]
MKKQSKEEIYANNIPILADATDRFLDVDTKQSAINCCYQWSSYLHHSANEPSMGMYRICEHTKNKIPKIVELKTQLKKNNRKVNSRIIDINYSVKACKSINANVPNIFASCMKELSETFLSQQSSTIQQSKEEKNNELERNAMNENSEQLNSDVEISFFKDKPVENNNLPQEIKVEEPIKEEIKESDIPKHQTEEIKEEIVKNEITPEQNETINQKEEIVNDEEETNNYLELDNLLDNVVEHSENIEEIKSVQSNEPTISETTTNPPTESTTIEEKEEITTTQEETTNEITSPREVMASGDDWGTVVNITPTATTPVTDKKKKKKKKKKAIVEEDEQ